MDLSPGYRELAPPPTAGGALACLWVRVAPADAVTAKRVLPDACADVIWSAGRGAIVAGPDTGPALTPVPPGAIIVGARFAPGAGGPAPGIQLSELRDQRVSLDVAWPELDRRLPGDLAPAAALREVAVVATELARAALPDRAIGEAARALACPAARVEHLAAGLGLSERQLRRRCHATVGYGPKTLHRVLRFRRFLRASDATAAPDLARLAADAGYADQAHLTRECVRLAGLTPAALARSRGGA
jgi:AraC-like DNA-binding protein